MNKWALRFISLVLVCVATLVFAEPTLDQVYTAARTGHLAEARTMMSEVIQAHPNSAKAHFVNAEILAHSGDANTAKSELAIAEKLEPGLPFANARSVNELKQQLSMPGPIQSQRSSGTSWGTILLIGVIALFVIIWMVRRMTQQNPVVVTQNPAGGGYYPNGMPMGGGQPPMYPSGGSGMGSGLMGSLATGAALGAGLVAGEALAHRLVDGGSGSNQVVNDGFTGSSSVNNDMGGQDFGVSNSGSWDDSSGSSWDNSGDLGGGFDSGGGSDWS